MFLLSRKPQKLVSLLYFISSLDLDEPQAEDVISDEGVICAHGELHTDVRAFEAASTICGRFGPAG